MDPKSKRRDSQSTFVAPSLVGTLSDHRIRAVSCGAEHTCALSEAGLVLSWGAGLGQLGHAFEASAHTPRVISTLNHSRIVSVACGSMHSACVDSSGKVWVWGRGVNGQLGLGDKVNHQPTPACLDSTPSHESFVQVACGMAHTLALTASGDVYAWGWGRGGQLGLGSEDSVRAPKLIEALRGRRIRAVAAGVNFSVALSDNSQVYFWGTMPCPLNSNVAVSAAGNVEDDVAGNKSGDLLPFPVLLEAFSSKGILSVSAGGHHVLALSHAGDVYAWGSGVRGQLGLGDRKARSVPSLIKAFHGHSICQVACGLAHSAAVSDTGEVWSWGASSGGQGGATHARDTLIPRPVTGIAGKGVNCVSCGWSHSAAVTYGGSVYTWGVESEQGMLGHQPSTIEESTLASDLAVNIPYLPERSQNAKRTKPLRVLKRRNEPLSKSASILETSSGSSVFASVESSSPKRAEASSFHLSPRSPQRDTSPVMLSPVPTPKQVAEASLAPSVNPLHSSLEISSLQKKLRDAEATSKKSGSLVRKLRTEVKQLRETVDTERSGAKMPRSLPLSNKSKRETEMEQQIEMLRKQVEELTTLMKLQYQHQQQHTTRDVSPSKKTGSYHDLSHPNEYRGSTPSTLGRPSSSRVSQPWLQDESAVVQEDDGDFDDGYSDRVFGAPEEAVIARSSPTPCVQSAEMTDKHQVDVIRPASASAPHIPAMVRTPESDKRRPVSSSPSHPSRRIFSTSNPQEETGIPDAPIETTNSTASATSSWGAVIERVQVSPQRPKSGTTSSLLRRAVTHQYQSSLSSPSHGSQPPQRFIHSGSSEGEYDDESLDQIVQEDIDRQKELSRANDALTMQPKSPSPGMGAISPRPRPVSGRRVVMSDTVVQSGIAKPPTPSGSSPSSPDERPVVSDAISSVSPPSSSSSVQIAPAAPITPVPVAAVPGDSEDVSRKAARARWSKVRNTGTAIAKMRRAGALHRAAAADKPKLVSQLLQRGLDALEPDDEGRTPLHCACAANAFASARVLLDDGLADPNAWDDTNRSPLHLAAAVSADLCVLLLNHKAEVKKRDDTGSTPLHYAALAGLHDASAVLLERGADVDDKDDLGRTALHLAVHAGHVHVLVLLVDEWQASVNSRDAAGCSALHYAASIGDVPCIRSLIDRGALVSAEDSKGAQPIHFAAGEGHSTALEVLLASDIGGADISSVDKRGRSALHYACIKGSLSAVKAMLRTGRIEINRRDDAGWSSLHYAYREGHADVFDVLMEAGADPSELYRIQRRASAPIERRMDASYDEVLGRLQSEQTVPSAADQKPAKAQKSGSTKACSIM
eukprot:ANDGO_08539.mRNA.1 Ultraviolet-B receptor UVR8